MPALGDEGLARLGEIIENEGRGDGLVRRRRRDAGRLPGRPRRRERSRLGMRDPAQVKAEQSLARLRISGFVRTLGQRFRERAGQISRGFFAVRFPPERKGGEWVLRRTQFTLHDTAVPRDAAAHHLHRDRAEPRAGRDLEHRRIEGEGCPFPRLRHRP